MAGLMRSIWLSLTRRRRFGRSSRAGRSSRSGVALLIVIAGILLMTVIVSEIAYGSQVRLRSAAHQRDEAQAYWLAQSGVKIYQLILVANKQLANSGLADYGAAFGVNMGDALWQAVPFLSTGILRMVFGGADIEDMEQDELAAAAMGQVDDEVAEDSREETSVFSDRNWLDFDGDLVAEIVDEESRIGLNAFSTRSQTAILQEEATAMQLYGLMSGTDNDQWFHDRNVDRWELIGNVADWVDVDTMRSGPRSGYEDDLYNRMEPPYLSKNATFESLEEVQLVDGWAGEVYDRFGDSLTVWANGKININTADRAVMFGLLKAYLTPTPSDDFVNQLLEMLDEYKLLTSFQNSSSFVSYLENQGASVSEDMEKAITTSSSVFRITSSGVVDDAVVTITAILDFTSADTGKIAYWRMD